MAGLQDDLWIFSDENDLLDYVEEALAAFPPTPTSPLSLANAIRAKSPLPPFVPERFNELLLLVQKTSAAKCRIVSHIQIPLASQLFNDWYQGHNRLDKLFDLITANDPWGIGDPRYAARSWHLTHFAFPELEFILKRLEKISAKIPKPSDEDEEYHEQEEFDLSDASQKLLRVLQRALQQSVGAYILSHFYSDRY